MVDFILHIFPIFVVEKKEKKYYVVVGLTEKVYTQFRDVLKKKGTTKIMLEF